MEVYKSCLEQACPPETVMAAGMDTFAIDNSEGADPTSINGITGGVSFVELWLPDWEQAASWQNVTGLALQEMVPRHSWKHSIPLNLKIHPKAMVLLYLSLLQPSLATPAVPRSPWGNLAVCSIQALL